MNDATRSNRTLNPWVRSQATPAKHLSMWDTFTRSRVTSHPVHRHRAAVMDWSTFHEQNDAFGTDIAMSATGLNATGPTRTQGAIGAGAATGAGAIVAGPQNAHRMPTECHIRCTHSDASGPQNATGALSTTQSYSRNRQGRPSRHRHLPRRGCLRWQSSLHHHLQWQHCHHHLQCQ